jgi:hypothetical protein
MRRRKILWVGGLAALAGCGGDEAPAGPGAAAPLAKIAPTLPRLVRERTLAEWLGEAESPDAALRAQAPWALSELVTDPAQLAPLLSRLLADPSADVRYAAVVAVGRVAGPLPPEVDRAAVGLLGAREPGLALVARQAALQRGVYALGALGERVREGPEAEALLAARTIGALGAKAAPAAPDLLAGLERSLALGLDCARALERIGAAAAPAVAARLPEAAPPGSALLVGVASRLAPKAPALVPVVVAALERMDEETLAAAEAAVSALGEAALPALDDLAARDAGPAGERARRLAAQIRERAGGR